MEDQLNATDRDVGASRRGRLVAFGGIIALLVLFAALSWSASRTKCMTMDEPMHALGGWLWTHQRDFRFDPEDPPLWGYFMSIPNGREALRANFADPNWRAIAQTHWTQSPWWMLTLHETAGNDVYAFVRRAARMALILGILLGGTIAWYAWKTGGPIAALLAACLFALDPNFLGHAPLVKNDIAISLAFLALSYALWRAGTRLTWVNALAIAILCGVAMSIKFSGVLALPIAAVVLLVRAMLQAPWPVFRRTLDTRGGRLLASATLLTAAALTSVAVVWASYGFRYCATPDGTPLNIQIQAMQAIKNRLHAADLSHPPTLPELQRAGPGPFVRSVLTLNRLHLMPEAWNNGLLYTYQTSLLRPSYLLGDVRLTGWWYYFPLAMWFKTPLATMALALIAIVIAVRLPLRDIDFSRCWAMLCLLIPAAIYFTFALRTNLNIGLRHVLPIYPMLYIAIALILAQAWPRRMRFLRPITLILLGFLAFETLFAWPNYIAYFNLASGGPRGGIRLLGDSSLDWGQDLPLLAKWQEQHPDRPIHLRYFGSANPTDFVKSIPLDPVHPQLPAPPAVIAVSATFLQGLYVPDNLKPFYGALRRQTPIDVLGGTIYIFEPPPLQPAATSSPQEGGSTR